jgi:hypothetical protein
MIDVQRYRQGSLAIMARCDVLLLTPGWQQSEGCRAERQEWIATHSDPWWEHCWDMAEDGLTLIGCMEHWALDHDSPPLVYVSGPITAGVDAEITERLVSRAYRRVANLWAEAVASDAAALSSNLLKLADWSGRVRQAGGVPYNPSADMLEILVGQSIECAAEALEGEYDGCTD